MWNDRSADLKIMGLVLRSSFIATGRGSIPQGPMKKKASDRTWHDLRSLTTTNPSVIQPVAIVNPISPRRGFANELIVEATALQIDASGTIVSEHSR
jgi:large exoprotein involved in heme utilization and adhesion